ncbi:MAG: hypothetical protein AAF598_13855, partial [Bacteroidota bacterium]
KIFNQGDSDEVTVDDTKPLDEYTETPKKELTPIVDPEALKVLTEDIRDLKDEVRSLKRSLMDSEDEIRTLKERIEALESPTTPNE